MSVVEPEPFLREPLVNVMLWASLGMALVREDETAGADPVLFDATT